MWLNLVEYVLWEHVVDGSNPFIPTKIIRVVDVYYVVMLNHYIEKNITKKKGNKRRCAEWGRHLTVDQIH